MTNGDLNWGKDKRLWPRLTGWLQRRLQITWLPHFEPPTVAVALFPLGLFISAPLVWKKPVKLVDAQVPVRPVLHFRIGWRRDMNSGEFYPTAALKVEERVKLW